MITNNNNKMIPMSTLQTLVVDDSPSARVILKRLLEKSGIQVHLSNSGSEAISFLKENSPDLIFMDHTMPGMDGLETTKAITTNPKTASIPVVMYTSNDDEGYAENAKEHGAMGVVSKPASSEKLFSVLSDLFTIHRNQLESLNNNFNQRLDQFYNNMERLVEDRLAESEIMLHQHVDAKFTSTLQQKNSELPSKPREVLPLIHTITDAKIHQLNIELRNHMSAKLDVISQDLREDNRLHNQQFISEFGAQLASSSKIQTTSSPQPVFSRLITAISPRTLINAACEMVLSPNFYLGVLISACAILISL
ncbi:hypothetical protein A9Q99_19025 [Gammaproteobacteria bacterium 45_16_T64]|nr:hypothetical protein A9Q99_19025 [Gammaproteobacteria bacterium 45_16_T64]